MLEARYFTDQDLFEKIIESVFYKNWLLVCHNSQVEKPGDYQTLTIYDQDIIVARDQQGTLNAFYNVCQHRGHKLASGRGNKKLLVCPYHRWSYDLTGQLRAAPNSDSVPGFNKSEICLTSIKVENFLGFIFINLDPECASMDDTYPGVRDAMLELCPDVEQRRYAYHHEADEGCNWMTAVENYNECYHCKTCHAEFAKGIIDPESYSIAPFKDIQVLHHSSLATQSSDAWYDVSGADYGSFYLWPATSIQFYPGGVVNSFAWSPLAVDDVRVFRSFYSNDGQVDDVLQKVIDSDRETTFQEDLDIVKEVQRGLKSRGYKPGPLIVDPQGGIDNELPIQKLHQWLREAIA
ncbi:MAG: aromatic ring-hydroxylating dioxygenase subunit alpha [Pseudomonadota bacterium]